MSLPPLPIPRHRSSQPANVVQADQTLRDIYRSAISVLSLPSIDPRRTEYHLQTIARDAVPLLITVEDSSGSSELKKWVYECAEEFGALCIRLAEAGAQPDEENPNIHFINPVTTVRTGKRGQPRKVINPSYLRKAMNPKRRIPITVLAKALKVSTKTVMSSLKQNNINYKPSRISDRQLDDVIKTFQQKKPRSGEQYLTGYLRRSGLKVQRQRIRESVRRVDKLGHVLRLQQKRKIERVPYMVSRPNALWHIDGHHKLILWGIVIHGCVDGFSRKVTGLRASTDNRASTVLRMFSCTVNRYGWPSRVRGDRGGENRDVSVVMILHRGLRRGSFIWGSSTHNTRIERLWVEVGTQFVRAWRAFFFRLERRHYLDRKNPHHLWLLQFLFLDTINDDCKEFQKDWNAHPISGLGHGRSPNDLFFLGQLRHGIYKDDCEGCSPEEIARSYGVYGTPIHRHAHQTGAGHSSDEESESESDCEEWYGIDDETNSADSWYGIGGEADDVEVQAQFESDNESYQAVDAPDHSKPFDQKRMMVFTDALAQMREEGRVPSGYGLLEDELGEDGYPGLETISTGRSGSKTLDIVLPHVIWKPRAELWATALYLMDRLLEIGRGSEKSSRQKPNPPETPTPKYNVGGDDDGEEPAESQEAAHDKRHGELRLKAITSFARPQRSHPTSIAGC
ncbi:hypothetical protein D9758_012442 [Tetrapyrgos nigripes]|uniref:Integrase catalytic domain-containing protein n=1 Tax=Tetrapyrgos nigripes TaxID=182062 RepID=A0A8H5FV94_9AGAR|nr:hypothetical protein D9758_012442 [Tetrapyrgos nigripes]